MKNRIKELRIKAKMKQEDLAKLLNVDKSQISRYETGTLDVSSETLIKMAEIFNCSPNYILMFDELDNKETQELMKILKKYERVAIIANDSGITAEDLEATLKLIKKMHKKQD